MMKLRSHWKLILGGVMFIAGLSMLAFSLRQTVRIQVDGQVIEHTSFAIRPIDVLREAGIEISAADRVTPPRRTPLLQFRHHPGATGTRLPGYHPRAIHPGGNG